MDKNKWIEEKVKEFENKWPLGIGNSGNHYLPMSTLMRDTLEADLRQSLEEAWEDGFNDGYGRASETAGP